MKIVSKKVAFSTPWFDLVAKQLTGAADELPHYCLALSDYVSVVAFTVGMESILVRQFRPAVERVTLELPSGHVDSGETPVQAAARELFEETGYKAGQLELLGALCPDTGRMSNRVWYFLAWDAAKDHSWSGPEQGIEPVLKPITELMEDIRQVRFDHSLNLAPILLALLKSDRFRAQAPLCGATTR